MKKLKLGILGFVSLMISMSLPKIVSAHCPLCTVGAGAAAAGAVWLGVSKVVIALFLGAFAMSMGMWFSCVIKKRKVFFKGQSIIIILGIFLLTFIPLMPIVQAYGPLALNLVGGYGTLLNRVYMIDYSLYSGILGAVIVGISPSLNKKIKLLRKGKGIPYQGMLITFSLLSLVGLVIQFFIA